MPSSYENGRKSESNPPHGALTCSHSLFVIHHLKYHSFNMVREIGMKISISIG